MTPLGSAFDDFLKEEGIYGETKKETMNRTKYRREGWNVAMKEAARICRSKKGKESYNMEENDELYEECAVAIEQSGG